jgi:hypothetical protein
MYIIVYLFVLVQLEADENIRGRGGYEGVEITGDGVQAEISVRGTSATGTAGNNAEMETNVSMEVPATDVAIDPEVSVLESGFVFE